MVSGKEALAALLATEYREVEVAGLTFKVRGLNGIERALLRKRAAAGNGMEAYEIVALAVVDENGDPLFTMDQAETLGRVEGSRTEKLAEAILAASGLMPTAEDEAAKN